MPAIQLKYLRILFPLIGIGIFVILYILASFYYPGGSNLDHQSTGFDWLKNYWCDLTMPIAKNGSVNTSRPIALCAMVVLCISLATFWYYLPYMFPSMKYKKWIRSFGISAMAITFFLFTDLHDTIIHVAGLMGIIALIFTFSGLYQNNLLRFFYFGIFCMAMMLFNYFIYELNYMIIAQPVIQKINFTLFLSWICVMNVQIYLSLRSGKISST